ncbi:MAG TPA: aminotransferase class III-fold pyridoxal phosphate-dependent enzyme, partial [Ilumatobacteraceae bacterium]|nr:aminotransferase class III-fold pyridoxal phosphate-dependent enzyme [Ilumatobacteraceae bacterium]
IGAFRDENILDSARTLGTDVIGPELELIAERHPSVGEVRGLGAFWAIELVRDRDSREMYVPYNASGTDAKPMADVVAAIKEQGVWVFAHFNRIHITPPCNASHDDVRTGLAAIDKALEVADAHIG